MEWILTHSAELIAIVTAVVTTASLVANLTPTKVDNKILASIIKVVNLLGLNVKNNL